jgi:hypothetical protein
LNQDELGRLHQHVEERFNVMSKKSDDASLNLIQTLEEARKIKVTPERIKQNTGSIDDNNGSIIIL